MYDHIKRLKLATRFGEWVDCECQGIQFRFRVVGVDTRVGEPQARIQIDAPREVSFLRESAIVRGPKQIAEAS